MRFSTLAVSASAPLVLVALASTASAQQFQHQVGMIPGTPRWTEGVEAADVDNDGDLDLFFADGEGFMSAGTQRQNVLEINKKIETGILSFADESVARLGAHTSNAKGVTTGDIDGDGWIDALYSNAFNTAPASLYVNQGAGNPGFFTFDGVARGFTTNVSAGGAMFSDVDNDGDLDVVMNNNYIGTGSGKPRLYKNNGSGFFTLDAAGFAAAPSKNSHMDVQMVDVDGDFDLDFFGDNRGSNAGGNHFLMLNDGTGVFSDSSSLLPATSTSCYEAEVGDLDNDQDIDLFFVSLSGFSEGAVKNNLVPSSALTFTSQGAFGGDDDNEIALVDYDVDGDYDVIVGSLASREKLYRNDGNFTFVDQSTQITAVSDSSLDCTVADLDNDGRYDLITAQGESNSPQWANKVYRNVTGPMDNRAPVVNALLSPPAANHNDPSVVVQAKVRDQVLDDDVDFLTATARSVALPLPLSVNVTITPAGFVPPISNIAPGTSVVFTNASGAARTLASTTAPYVWSVNVPDGQSTAHYFVAQTSYGVSANPGAFAATINVSGGSVQTTKGLHVGVTQYRYALPNPLGPTGAQLVYELEFKDWAGNRTITNNGVIALVDCSFTTYCTSKPSSLPGCVPTLQAAGTPSASTGSGFVVSTTPTLGGKVGLFIYTTQGAAAVPSSTPFGFLCIGPSGIKRIASQTTGGTNGLCNGSMSVDFNLYYATQTGDPSLVPGATVDLQAWYRDPADAGGADLTNAGAFVMCP
jgi:FG-GAP-like repeat